MAMLRTHPLHADRLAALREPEHMGHLKRLYHEGGCDVKKSAASNQLGWPGFKGWGRL